MTNIDVVKMICSKLDVAFDDCVEFVAERPGQDVRYGINDDKIRSLGWKAKTSFAEGLDKVILATKQDLHW